MKPFNIRAYIYGIVIGLFVIGLLHSFGSLNKEIDLILKGIGHMFVSVAMVLMVAIIVEQMYEN